MKFARRSEKFPILRIFSLTLRLLLVLTFVALVSLPFLSSPVQAAPTIVASPLPTGQVNVSYLATLTAVPLTCPCTWTVTSGSLPPGLTLNATSGTISGIPTTAGNFAFFVMVTDTTGPSAQQSFFITINPPPFLITTTDLPPGKEGTAYSATFSATGGTLPYTWSLASGNLPSGLTLGGTTGVILGTPTRATAGTYTFMVNVTDSSSPQRTAQKSFSIYIEKGVFQSTISIGPGLQAGSTKVSVDGKTAATLKGGEYITFNFDLGVTRNISVEPIVAHPTDPGIRFKAKSESISVSELQPNAEFAYSTEYLINVKTEPLINIQLQGSGWYAKDMPVNIITKTEVEGNPGTLYKFTYWLLPNNQKINTEQANFTVTSPATIVAYYDTYYKLTTESSYGVVEGGGWYKAGSQARWTVVNDKVPMPGIIGLFQGKYKAINPSGTEDMNEPKTVTVFWEPDYTLPYILIPITILVFILVIVGIYFLLRRQQPHIRPQPIPAAAVPPPPPYPPYMPPPRPIPQQHTTVVMISDKGDQTKQLPQSTKEQLMEKFGELLEKYETEIKASLGTGATELPKIGAFPQEKMISAPPPVPPQSTLDADFSQKEAEEQFCRYNAKKLLRTVTSTWRQVESDTITLPSTGENEKSSTTGLLIAWARDIYHEWEILSCSLPPNHEGKHKGGTQVVYSLLNTVTEKKVYSSSDRPEPPTPHFTDGMPQLELSDDQIVPPAELPSETIK